MTHPTLFDDPTVEQPVPEHRVQFLAGCLATWWDHEQARKGRKPTAAERRAAVTELKSIARDSVGRAARVGQ